MALRGKMITGRWCDLVADALPDGEVLFSTGTDDYQGSVAIVARLDDGRWLQYDWSYGSCSVCDSWEDLPESEVKVEIGEAAAILPAVEFARYLANVLESKADWLRDPSTKDGSWVYSEHIGLTVEELLMRVQKEAVNG